MSNYKPDIWRLQAQMDTQGLIEALQNDDASIRKRAAAALRAIGATEAVPALRVALVNEQDPDARTHIATALETLTEDPKTLTEEVAPVAPPTPAEQHIQQLSSSDPQQVIEAARKLGELGDKQAVEPLVMLFNNGKVPIDVRLAVAEALLKLESAPVEVALLGALRSDDWQVRRNGAAILGKLKAEWAVEPLAGALRDPNPTVRKTARAALKFIGTPEALSRLPAKTDQSTETIETETVEGDKSGAPLSWPRARRDEQPFLAPTQPLDPRALEDLERRRSKKTGSDREPPEGQSEGDA